MTYKQARWHLSQEAAGSISRPLWLVVVGRFFHCVYSGTTSDTRVENPKWWTRGALHMWWSCPPYGFHAFTGNIHDLCCDNMMRCEPASHGRFSFYSLWLFLTSFSSLETSPNFLSCMFHLTPLPETYISRKASPFQTRFSAVCSSVATQRAHETQIKL